MIWRAFAATGNRIVNTAWVPGKLSVAMFGPYVDKGGDA